MISNKYQYILKIKIDSTVIYKISLSETILFNFLIEEKKAWIKLELYLETYGISNYGIFILFFGYILNMHYFGDDYGILNNILFCRLFQFLYLRL